MNLFDRLAASPAPTGKIVLETLEGRAWSKEALLACSARYAHALVAAGVRPGDRIAVQAEKSPECLALYLAALRCGGVFLPLNTAYAPPEMEYFLGNAEPAVVVGDPARGGALKPLAAAVGARLFTLDAHGGGSLPEAAQGAEAEFATVARADGDLAAILYTSGTTGRSKGAMLSHDNLASNSLVLQQAWGWRADDVLLHGLPIFHVHGLFVAAQGALLAGAKMLWLPKWDASAAARWLPRASVFMGVPTMYGRLLDEPRLTRDAVAGVRLFVSGSAPLSVDTFRAWQERTGHTILERYGMSETCMLTSNPYRAEDGPRLGGTVGPALPGVELRVVDGEGRACAEGQVGDVQVRGPNVCLGYWRAPEKTQQDWTPDGWFQTGDVGRLGGPALGTEAAPATYLSIVGRSKDLIIAGGFNIYPKEVESQLDELPGVLESAVFGIPDADLGERVAAVVVPRPGATLVPEELISALRARLASFKVPKRLEILPELPRNAMGKVLKAALRERAK
ncbi:MAG: AMP-binding protein [Verrucomicrobia bacterium]|nr:AMP-binding protein [Verrucomicrobiota bacterium]